MNNGKFELSIGKFIILIFYSFLIIFFLLVPRGNSAIVAEIEINGLYSIDKEELLYLLDITPGSPVDSEKVRQGIKRAFLKGVFEDISIEATDEEKARVTITVKERDFIEKISVEGNYDISRRFIKNNFLLKEEHVMRYDLLDAAIGKLRHEIALRGFPNSNIKASIERLKKPYRINIHLQVNTGEPEIIKKITVPGGSEEIIRMMSLSEGDIYDQVKLVKDIEKIKTYYKKNGYYRPVIGPYTFAEGTLTLPVNPGNRLIISIEGNSAISTKTFLKEMPFFEAEDFNDDIVEEAVSKMLSLYYTKGYSSAQIAPVITSKDGLVSLTFFIFEGKTVKVKTISFSGISLPEKNLKEVMSLKEEGLYNPDIVDTDTEAIEGFYNALGYSAASVEEFQTRYEESSQTMDIHIKIHEGVKTEIKKIDIVGTRLVPEEEVRKSIKITPGDPYNEVDISDAQYRIIQLYNSRGLADAFVSVKRDFEGQKLSLTFQIYEGDVTFFGKTIITGNYRTRYEVVKRESRHHEGVLLDENILAQERQGLYKLGLFTDVNIELLDRYDHKRDILTRLNEGDAGAVELGFGYGDFERFRGFLDLSYRNLWGMNRQASLRFELSSLEKRAIFQYLEPWFLNKQMPFRTFLIYEDREELNFDTRETLYRLKRYGASAGIEKKLSNTMKSELYYEFSLVKTSDVKPDVILSKEDTGAVAISALRPAIVYDTRDNPFNPKKGILSGIQLKVTSPLLLSETNFIKLLANGSTYQELSKRFVLALSLRAGTAWGYHDTEELPIVERFFLGGRTTVRGYRQDTLGPKGPDGNPTGGNAFLCGNLELRSYLGKGIGIVAFLDGGNVWLKANNIDPGDLKYSTGLGLRYNTPVGPISIDYGHKLNKQKGESSGEIHFSIGHAF
jgi:outer membrane protein insertion porin family